MVKGIIRVSAHALKRIKEREIDIEHIEQEQKDEIVVVTVLKVDDVRLNRYGFSRI